MTEIRYHLKDESDDTKVVHVTFYLKRELGSIYLMAENSNGEDQYLLKVKDGKFYYCQSVDMVGIESDQSHRARLMIWD